MALAGVRRKGCPSCRKALRYAKIPTSAEKGLRRLLPSVGCQTAPLLIVESAGDAGPELEMAAPNLDANPE